MISFSRSFQTDTIQFESLQYALFITCFVEIIGGVFFLITSTYILRDKKRVEEAVAESQMNDAISSQSTTQHDQHTTESQ